MYGYIYETTCLTNGKKYIGQKKSNKFLGTSYLGSGVLICRAIEKYGKDNFSVEMLEACYSSEMLNDREYYWINKKNAVDSESYYNLRDGGMQGGFSECVCKHISDMHKGTVWMHKGEVEIKVNSSKISYYESEGYILGQSDSHHHKLEGQGNGMYGKTHSEDVKAKLRYINTVNNLSSGKHWYTNGLLNIFCYEDDDRITSEFHRGRIRTSGMRSKLSNSMKGMRHINNGNISIRVPDDELESYLSSGWKPGYIKHKSDS